MVKTTYWTVPWLLMLVSASVFAEVPAGCRAVSSSKMTFIDVLTVDRSENFLSSTVGRFRVTNSGRDALVLDGVRLPEGFFIAPFLTRLDVEGERGMWKPDYIEGASYAVRLEKLTVIPGASVDILAPLHRYLKFAGFPVRLRDVIYTEKLCVVSEPFSPGKGK